MRNLLAPLAILILLELVFHGCANIGSPTGGPRDTIPPFLLQSTPENGTVNFQEQELFLEFSEFVATDKIQQQLIITPIIENKYKTIIKRNGIILRFDEPFADSTTYNLNFSNSIVDITEKNPAVNLSLAFSTGPYIDSMSIAGNIIDLFKQQPAVGYTVGLYPLTDSLDFFRDQPNYFTTSNDSGNFQINYVKADLYRLMVFNDENNNIILDPDSEPHGFIPDTLVLDSSVQVTFPIATLLQDVKPIRFINSRPTGPYIELKYSKYIDQYSLLPEDIRHNTVGESNDVIRIYKSEDVVIGDSLIFYATVQDSLGNQSQDTIKTTFVASNRQPAKFTYNVIPKTRHVIDSNAFRVTFNKPVYIFDSLKFYLKKDSLLTWPIQPQLTWNDNHTEVLIKTNINKQVILDTLLTLLPVDTTIADSIELPPVDPFVAFPTLAYVLDTAAFLSIESDTSNYTATFLPTKESTSFGTVKMSITTDYTSYNVQLVDQSGQTQYSSRNSTQINFPRVTPGNYSIRVLIDEDEDGEWSAGNLLLNTIPEPIYLHEEETTVRENWVLELDISF